MNQWPTRTAMPYIFKKLPLLRVTLTADYNQSPIRGTVVIRTLSPTRRVFMLLVAAYGKSESYQDFHRSSL